MEYLLLSEDDQKEIARRTLKILEQEHFQVVVQLTGLDVNDLPPEMAFLGPRQAELVSKIEATRRQFEEAGWDVVEVEAPAEQEGPTGEAAGSPPAPPTPSQVAAQ